ncbi:hypothetical protein SO802_005558 [Lithocarpus litseifolius]|uniref:PB1-like domain-containing protein n=1 Tax=Lithocarpus litseifolius TaxID=425828 RepID=A0AAW2DMQ9_9ROSI
MCSSWFGVSGGGENTSFATLKLGKVVSVKKTREVDVGEVREPKGKGVHSSNGYHRFKVKVTSHGGWEFHDLENFDEKMADLTFNFEIHHGGQFVWNPDLVYLGGSTSFIDDVDLDKLSYFEIQDMCCGLGANSTSRFHYLIPGGNLEQGLRLINEDDDVVYMCEIHAAWPTDKITLYVEGGEEPLAVEQPFANEEVANDDDVHEVP